MNIEETLKERGTRYGEFYDHAELSQQLKRTMKAAPRWEQLNPDMKEALEMIQHKIARILNGDPNYADSWRDIAGYATLIENRLESSLSPIALTASIG